MILLALLVEAPVAEQQHWRRDSPHWNWEVIWGAVSVSLCFLRIVGLKSTYNSLNVVDGTLPFTECEYPLCYGMPGTIGTHTRRLGIILECIERYKN